LDDFVENEGGARGVRGSSSSSSSSRSSSSLSSSDGAKLEQESKLALSASLKASFDACSAWSQIAQDIAALNDLAVKESAPRQFLPDPAAYCALRYIPRSGYTPAVQSAASLAAAAAAAPSAAAAAPSAAAAAPSAAAALAGGSRLHGKRARHAVASTSSAAAAAATLAAPAIFAAARPPAAAAAAAAAAPSAAAAPFAAAAAAAWPTAAAAAAAAAATSAAASPSAATAPFAAAASAAADVRAVQLAEAHLAKAAVITPDGVVELLDDHPYDDKLPETARYLLEPVAAEEAEGAEEEEEVDDIAELDADGSALPRRPLRPFRVSRETMATVLRHMRRDNDGTCPQEPSDDCKIGAWGSEYVTFEHLQRLAPGQWLNDEVLNFFFARINSRNRDAAADAAAAAGGGGGAAAAAAGGGGGRGRRWRQRGGGSGSAAAAAGGGGSSAAAAAGGGGGSAAADDGCYISADGAHGGPVRAHCMRTFFVTKLTRKGDKAAEDDAAPYDYAGVRKWTTAAKLDPVLREMRYWLFPIHIGIHWALAVLDVRRATLHYIDSLAPPCDWPLSAMNAAQSTLRAILRWWSDETANKWGESERVDTSGWTIVRYHRGQTPQQENGFDCGMFMAHAARCIMEGHAWDFSQADMRDLRAALVADIFTCGPEGAEVGAY